MTGTERYDNEYEMMAMKRINKNLDKPYLDEVYYYILAGNSYSAAYGYLGCIINFIDYIDNKDPKEITVNDYTKYLTSIKKKSSSYRIMVYSALKKYSSYLKANGYNEDYMAYIQRPKFKESIQTKEKRENGFMTTDEMTTFINNIKNSNKKAYLKIRDLAIVSIMLNTGIRCSALQKLDVNDVNHEKKCIVVVEKGGNQREINISDSTIEKIDEWLEYRRYMKLKPDENGLFISENRTRITRRAIYNMIKSYGWNIEGKNITPHKTRSTYGTQLYNQTHDLYFVQECMGHSNPKTTELYIRGQKEEMSKKASNIMNNLMEF